MNDRDALVATVADKPGEDAPRFALGDWLQEHGQPARAEFVRLQCQAKGLRSGTAERADAWRAADDLRAEHEADWLGDWADRLVTWEYRRGFLWCVRMTANEFLSHGEELFRTEPVQRLELVTEPEDLTFSHGDPLDEKAVAAVVAHPAYAHVRECAVVTGFGKENIDVWLTSLAAATHVRRLRAFGPCGGFDLYNEFSARFGLNARAVAAFCGAPHLRTIRSLDLGSCPLRNARDKDQLANHVATAPFAPNLRRLDLSQCRLTGVGLGRLASDPAFGRLRSLNVTNNATDEPTAWEGLFQSRTLKELRSFELAADRLPEYAGSPLAARVRDLTVHSADDLDRDRGPDRPAWMRLIATAPPPRRLKLVCHNPGRAVFVEMRKRRWLRDIRELAIQSDSQYGVYGGRRAGVRSLFRPKAMPQLTRLNLHEVGSPDVLKTLAAWPGLSRLESLDLGDDYHGRFKPTNFSTGHSLACLRSLRGVILSTDEDVEQFLALPGLENLTTLQMSFLGPIRASFRYTDPTALTEVAVDRLIRSERLSRLTDLTLGFGYIRRIEFHVEPQFADPAVMPRLEKLHLYVSRDGRFDDRPPIERVRARFGLRLVAY